MVRDVEPARVLVVDDDREFRDYVSALLAEAGCLVSCAHDGARAIHQLRCGYQPDVIICDMRMPGIDGLALLAHVRRCRETEQTPVIFVSGDPSERVEALEQGANDFIMKPPDSRELIARVRCQLRTARASRSWRQRSFVDPLTGLLNRRGFADQIGREIDRATRHRTSLSIVFMDLDGFKAVNDRLGHDVGDELLIRFARILERNLRGSDLAVRWGGDEFVLGLPGSDRAAALRVAERVRRNATALFEPLPLRVGVSVGVSCLFEDVRSTGPEVAARLIHAADLAMYSDKRASQRGRLARGSRRVFQTPRRQIVTPPRPATVDDWSGATPAAADGDADDAAPNRHQD